MANEKLLEKLCEPWGGAKKINIENQMQLLTNTIYWLFPQESTKGFLGLFKRYYRPNQSEEELAEKLVNRGLASNLEEGTKMIKEIADSKDSYHSYSKTHKGLIYETVEQVLDPNCKLSYKLETHITPDML